MALLQIELYGSKEVAAGDLVLLTDARGYTQKQNMGRKNQYLVLPVAMTFVAALREIVMVELM